MGEMEVCATYVNTGKKYSVKANVLMGSELNRITKSIRFSSFDKYVVLFWNPGEATIIELGFSPGGIGIFDTDGKDQRGYPWRVSKGSIFC